MTIQEKARAWKECPIMTDELMQELHSMNDAEMNDSFYRNEPNEYFHGNPGNKRTWSLSEGTVRAAVLCGQL